VVAIRTRAAIRDGTCRLGSEGIGQLSGEKGAGSAQNITDSKRYSNRNTAELVVFQKFAAPDVTVSDTTGTREQLLLRGILLHLGVRPFQNRKAKHPRKHAVRSIIAPTKPITKRREIDCPSHRREIRPVRHRLANLLCSAVIRIKHPLPPAVQHNAWHHWASA